MPRVTSQKLRQMILELGDPLSPGELPEKLSLYSADGTPIDLNRDGTRMLWRGEWSGDASYIQNDVVIDEGDLFILEALAIGPGEKPPHEEHSDVEVTVEFPGAGGGTAYPLIDGERVVDPYVGQSKVYFDLISGGTITVIDLDLPSEYMKLYDSDGEELVTNYGMPGASNGPWGAPLVVNDLSPGRYFIEWQEPVWNSPVTMHLQVTLSNGAQYTLPAENWSVLFRAGSGPQGEPGPQGEQGPQGEPGEQGPPGTSFAEAWKGEWAAGAYVEGDVVRHNDGLFLATDAAIATDEPGVSADPNPWELMVQGV